MFQPHAFFYQSHRLVVDKHAPVEKTPAIFVHKESTHYNFTGMYKLLAKEILFSAYILKQLLIFAGHHNLSVELKSLNDSLYRWVNAERFSTFPKVTRGNIHQLFLTNKNLVLAIVEENQLEEIPPDMIEFRNMVESVIKTKREFYHE